MASSLIFAFLFYLFFLFISPRCDGHTAVLCKASEREALLQFKHGVASNSRLSSWTDGGGDCCKWTGVACNNQTGHVIELSLPYSWENGNYYPLRGRINPSLASLKYLQHLDLSRNDFEGSTIPPFLGSFENLRYLNLSDANLSGVIPPQLGNLSSLEALDLSQWNFNRLQSDGEWLSNLSSLRYLVLNGANLSKATGLFQALNMLPFLSNISLSDCFLDPPSLLVSNASFKRLLSLDLSINGMEFKLPGWLLNVTSLEYLDLSHSDILHDANDIAGNLCNLRSLNLQDNLMDADIGHFFMGCNCRLKLERLDLSYNYITGQLPVWLGDYKHLKWLDLRDNSISGSIPETVCGMVSIEHLDLSKNNLSGSIPSSFWKLRFLQYLDLSENNLHGNFSEENFCHLTDLITLKLSSNSVQLALSPSWTPPFSLKTLGMGSCKLGPRFPLWLQTQVNLRELNMSNSSISDVLPQWIWNFSSKIYSIDLSVNMLKGIIPTVMNQSSIQYVDIMVLSLSGNNLSGPVPSALCNSTSLEILDLSNNHLSGPLPSCLGAFNEYMRALNISCGITSLHLGNNNLEGILPASLQNCKYMSILDLGNNRFTGNMPSWINAKNMYGLRVLRLRSNLFYGSIPPQLSDLRSLQVLDLAKNNFSGSLPPTFGNFTVMKDVVYTSYGFNGERSYTETIEVTFKGRKMNYSTTLKLFASIDLSENRLSGEIPGAIGSLHGLLNLNLSENLFNGRIPDSFGMLYQLESLDLSGNNLSGNIPESLTNLTFMSRFNVSFNHLCGRIPSGAQFDTFSSSSYVGNFLLCGKPLEACESNHPSNSADANNVNGANDSIWLFCSIVLGFIVGFWTFWGTLFLKSNWRKPCNKSSVGYEDEAVCIVMDRRI